MEVDKSSPPVPLPSSSPSSSHSSSSLNPTYYPIKCILPSEKCFVRTGCTFTLAGGDENVQESDLQTKKILHMNHIGVTESKDCEALGDEFNFIYTNHLIFLSRYELFNSCQWNELDENNEDGLTSQEMTDFQLLKAQLNKGEIFEGLLVRHLSNSEGMSAGHGLFATKSISAGTFIGEYVGVVSSGTHAGSFSYCMQYPSSDGNGSFSIDATEYGNATRFINHSFRPNCLLRTVFLDGLAHCIFITCRDIHPVEQLTFNYGSSYWSVQDINLIDM